VRYLATHRAQILDCHRRNGARSVSRSGALSERMPLPPYPGLEALGYSVMPLRGIRPLVAIAVAHCLAMPEIAMNHE
jgi:hypothetical protein